MTEQVAYKLNEQELETTSQELAEKVKEHDTLSLTAKDSASTYRKELRILKERITHLADVVQTGQEVREIDRQKDMFKDDDEEIVAKPVDHEAKQSKKAAKGITVKAERENGEMETIIPPPAKRGRKAKLDAAQSEAT